VEADEADINTFYLMVCGAFVFLMQAGFALLAAGSVRAKNVKNILLKSVCDACLGGLVWFLVGYSVAYHGGDAPGNHSVAYHGGDAPGNPFIGTDSSYLALSGVRDWEKNDQGASYAGWMFQYAFAAAAATIVSGAVAERCTFVGYLCYAVVIIGLIYPVVVHWVWDPLGWLSASNPQAAFGGMIDFAGSGVVHMTGGVAAFVAAGVLGHRLDRWENPAAFQGQDAALQVIGTFLLWFGWYGFNPGSTLALHNADHTLARDAARAAITTTLSAAAAATTGLLIKRHLPESLGGSRTWDLAHTCNSLLGGLVSITAGCSTVSPAASLLIGCAGAWIYHAASCLMRRLRIDDPLDAFAVHGACGFWGCVSVGLFASRVYSYSPHEGSRFHGDEGYDAGLLNGGRGVLLAAQLAGALSIVCWVAATSGLLFWTLRALNIFRISEEMELAGSDFTKHGGPAYPWVIEGEAQAGHGSFSKPAKRPAELAPLPQTSGPSERPAELPPLPISKEASE